MTTTTAPLAVPPRTPHSHRKPKRPGVPWPIQAVMIIAFAALGAGFLMAAGQQLPRQQPRCVRWHSCACRFPGQGNDWHGNQLCAINWKPAPRALPHGGGPR